MTLTFAIAIYFIIWWMTLFAVLPFFARTQDEAGSVVPGTPESAPSKPGMARIFLANTILASLVFALVWSIIVFHWIDLDLFQIETRMPT
jgi:predicted secreted protein